MGRPPADLTGQRFGRLLAAERAGERDREGKILWVCLCECGTRSNLTVARLRGGGTQSCGCLIAEVQAERMRRDRPAFKHGYHGTPTYASWQAMKGRCLNPNDDWYSEYGGRGITVCESWAEPRGFVAFLADMGEKPPGMTLDRIDNDGNYEPGNCKWSTPAEQNQNTRTFKLTDAKILQIRNMWLAGHDRKTIREAVGISKPQVQVVIRTIEALISEAGGNRQLRGTLNPAAGDPLV